MSLFLANPYKHGFLVAFYPFVTTYNRLQTTTNVYLPDKC